MVSSWARSPDCRARRDGRGRSPRGHRRRRPLRQSAPVSRAKRLTDGWALASVLASRSASRFSSSDGGEARLAFDGTGRATSYVAAVRRRPRLPARNLRCLFHPLVLAGPSCASACYRRVRSGRPFLARRDSTVLFSTLGTSSSTAWRSRGSGGRHGARRRAFLYAVLAPAGLWLDAVPRPISTAFLLGPSFSRAEDIPAGEAGAAESPGGAAFALRWSEARRSRRS